MHLIRIQNSIFIFYFSSLFSINPTIFVDDVDEAMTLGTWVKVSLLVGWRLMSSSLPGSRRLISCPPGDLGYSLPP